MHDFISIPEDQIGKWLIERLSGHTVVLLTIDKPMAVAMLARNLHNRKLRAARVDTLATDNREGRFIFNGETISFDTNKVLANGQHRLTMVVTTGIPINALVVFGLDPDAQKTMDSQAPRSAADVVSLLGYASANEVTAVSGYLQEWERLGTIPTNSARRATRGQRIEYVEEQGERITSALSAIPKTDVASRSILATCYARFLSRTDEDTVSRFIRHLVTGANLDETDPIFVARKQLSKMREDMRSNRASNNRTAPFEVIVHAWNKWRRGEQVRRAFTLTGVLPAIEV